MKNKSGGDDAYFKVLIQTMFFLNLENTFHHLEKDLGAEKKDDAGKVTSPVTEAYDLYQLSSNLKPKDITVCK